MFFLLHHMDGACVLLVTMTCTTYLSIVADHMHPLIEMVFSDGCGLFQQNNELCLKAKMVQEWF